MIPLEIGFRTCTLILAALPAVLSVAGCASGPATDDSAAGVQIVRADGGYVFTENGDSIMVYRAEAVDPEREHARSHYVHPLYSLDGIVLTEDFPEDHLHQHGLFWAWHQLYVGDRRVGDGWTQDRIEWTVREVEILDEQPAAALRTYVDWSSSSYMNGGESIIEEIATLRAYPQRKEYREVDVTISLRALVDDVRIGGSEDEKGYGGLSLRIKLPEDVAFVGPGGPVEPKVTAVEAGPWVDVAATFGGRPSGVAMMQHPSNPSYPQTWILRASESMQNAKWPGEDAVFLPTDEPITLRYRLVVHDGHADAVPLDSLHEAYAR